MAARPTITDLSRLVNYEQPDWPAPACVRAVTTLRDEGVSEGVYASLNLALHVDDDKGKVLANRARLKQALSLPAEPAWLQQVHGTQIIDLDVIQSASSFEPSGGFEAGGVLEADGVEADGAISSSAESVCAIMTADCMPVFLCDRHGGQVALLHAGWRGLAGGIVEACIAKMHAKPEDIMVWAGPCIGPDNFEIGAEVRAELGGSDRSYKSSGKSNKFYADLYDLLAERLETLAIGHYSHSDSCTMRDAKKYFSYRRDGQCGRMVSLIWIIA
ncbi:MAG: YfiH family protein [Cryomorphaceae bacterium]|jgi:YfiH family protein